MSPDSIRPVSGPAERRLPGKLRVDYGAPAPGSSNPMPAEVRAAYERRIAASAEALADGARLAGRLFIGGGNA
jgi:hypothetical protein